MRVGLIGAPKSGKTRVANAMAARLDKESWKVVDKYVDRLAKRTGLPYDYQADFPGNVSVMCERWNAEHEALKGYPNIITCGTLYETLAYTLAIEFPQPQSEAEMVAQVQYLDVNYRFLGAMEDTTTNYDLLFYLPYKEKQSTWHGIIDQKIPDILETEFRRAYTLTGTTKEKVNAALEKISDIREIKSASTSAEAE